MILDPTLTISVDRTSLGLPPLVFGGTTGDGNVWGILPGYTQPGLDVDEVTASSPLTHSEVTTRWKYRRALHQFDAFPNVATPSALTAAKAELRAALGRTSYNVTVVENGESTTWACNVGRIQPSPIDYPELKYLQPAYSLTIPCYPIAGGGGATTGLYVVAPTVPLA